MEKDKGKVLNHILHYSADTLPDEDSEPAIKNEGKGTDLRHNSG
jgi:hypothetical protein